MVINGEKYINLASNNYFEFANNPSIIESVKKAIDERGFGTTSVRFICGT